MRKSSLLLLLVSTALHAQLTTFTAGAPAKAAEVNGNFAYLAARIDSLVKRLDSVGASAGIPKGTIAAFLTAPGLDSYLPGSGQTWLIAAGQGTVNGIAVPDLRGQFLRGLDLTVTGASSTRYDADTGRTAGSQQPDAFQGHWHLANNSANDGSDGTGYLVDGPGPDGSARFSMIGTRAAIADGVNGAPRTAPETRPKNVAVYWYIKVK